MKTLLNRGYSLIELILVVSAIILISSFGLARYSEFNDRQSVRQAADTLVSNLRLVQAKALSGDKPVGCTTLIGWTVEFRVKDYQMYAQCSPEGIIESTRITVELPANVNLFTNGNDTLTYYTGGKGTSADFQIEVFGLTTDIPIVLSDNSITMLDAIEATLAVASPTPTPYVCPWPEGDPRCADAPTPTDIIIDDGDEQFACEASGGAWQSYTSSCQDQCFLLGDPAPSCPPPGDPVNACNCGADKCWDGATCVDNPPVPTPTIDYGVCTCAGGNVQSSQCISTGMPSCTGQSTCACISCPYPPGDPRCTQYPTPTPTLTAGTCTCTGMGVTGSNCQDPNPIPYCMSPGVCQCRNCVYPPGDPRCP